MCVLIFPADFCEAFDSPRRVQGNIIKILRRPLSVVPIRFSPILTKLKFSQRVFGKYLKYKMLQKFFE
jgi:hypothetical protein